VDGTGSGSCPVAGCGVSSIDASGSVTRELIVLSCECRFSKISVD
jgi:hypothetical protein